MPEKKPLIQVLDRALDLMEMLARSKTPLRATDIAREMGLSLQSANNLLRALYLRGYLSQDESRSYRLGPQCLYLGSFADRWSELRAAVAPALAELTRKTGLSGFVGIIENDKLLCVALVPAELPKLPIQPPQLWMEELHCTACGRVLLAALTQEERRRLFARTTRRKITGGPRWIRRCSNSSVPRWRRRGSPRWMMSRGRGSLRWRYRSGTKMERYMPPSRSPGGAGSGSSCRLSVNLKR